MPSHKEGGMVMRCAVIERNGKPTIKVEDGKVRYEGKEIIFPSETEMYHVDRKKFETIEEVLNYLKN